MIHLYSDSDPFSHRVRFILYEKDMDFKIIDVLKANMREELITLNPYNQTPVLVDDIDKNLKKKDLILTDTNIMCEYIDERFPHPQLMPIEPTEKARIRMSIHHFEKELFSHVRTIENNLNSKEAKIKKEVEKSKKVVLSHLDNIAKTFQENRKMEYAFGTSLSLIDMALIPLLWRLKYYGLEEKSTWGNMMKYAEKQFMRQSFINSMTPSERSMRR